MKLIRSQTVYLSAYNRHIGDNHDFHVTFRDGQIQCKRDEYMRLSVISFSMYNTRFNINEDNNKVRFVENDIANNAVVNYDLTINPGNYTMQNFANTVKDAYNSVRIAQGKAAAIDTFIYNTNTGKFEIAFFSNGNAHRIELSQQDAKLLWGFDGYVKPDPSQNTFSLTIISDNIVLPRADNEVCVRVYGVTPKAGHNLELVGEGSTTAENSQCILCVHNNVPPFDYLFWRANSVDEYSFYMQEKSVRSLRFVLTDFHGNVMDDHEHDITMVLRLDVYKDEDEGKIYPTM